MKLKLLQVVNSVIPMRKLMVEKFPVHIAYRIQRNAKILEHELQAYKKMFDELVAKKHESVDKADADKMKQLAGEIEADHKLMMDEEIEIEIRTLSLSDVPAITPGDLMALEWMFDDPDAAEPEPAAKPRKRAGVGSP